MRPDDKQLYRNARCINHFALNGFHLNCAGTPQCSSSVEHVIVSFKLVLSVIRYLAEKFVYSVQFRRRLPDGWWDEKKRMDSFLRVDLAKLAF